MSDDALQAAMEAHFASVLDDLVRRSAVTDAMIHKDLYRILVSTLWVNVVLDPANAGLEDTDLEPLHDVLNRRIAGVLGPDESLTSCFRYLNGKAGEQAMKTAGLTPEHRDLLLYFASMILDPDGHRRWTEAIRNRPRR